ncbi:uncharacterized protein SAPINGB_P001364 [Magnusiomyces paraingens]|uniref:J domain-containing protein n=1 Tax=Magnusiomyces paraingens TaxID=2606893 RepID=A0A5E8B5C2_9ASCO|nr:uncharacterized protein SAPINGB_P001364 [Saprochaete ingens]VVT46742.1 unnamed protein product [Saprochaete ingens]
MTYTTLYNRLGIQPNASQAQILEAYRNLVKHMHPDKLPPPRTVAGIKAAVSFKKIYIAYEVLSSSSARAAYDRGGMTEVCRIEGATWWLAHCETIARQLPPINADNDESEYEYEYEYEYDDDKDEELEDFFEPEPRHCTCLMESVPARNTTLKFGPISSLVTYTCEVCRQIAAEKHRLRSCRHKPRRVDQWVEKTLEYLDDVQYYEECDPLPPLPENENTALLNNVQRPRHGNDDLPMYESICQNLENEQKLRPRRGNKLLRRQWCYFFFRRNKTCRNVNR